MAKGDGNDRPSVFVEFDEEKRTATINWRGRDPVVISLDGCSHENKSDLNVAGVPVSLCENCKAFVFGRKR